MIRKFSFSLILLAVLTAGTGCQKSSKNEFGSLEGTWTVSKLSLSDVMHNGPPVIPQIGKTYVLVGSKIAYCNATLIPDSNWYYSQVFRDTLNWNPSVTTKLKDDHILMVTENYDILNHDGTVFKSFRFYREIALKSGISSYSEPNDAFSIDEHNMSISIYTWSGNNAQLYNRTLTK